MKTTTTCSTCLNFADIGEGRECLNLVSFRKDGATESTPPQATDTCPDHDPSEFELMTHPDGDFLITLKCGDHGVLTVTGEDGSTVRVTLGALGLIELGLAIAHYGKKMLE